MTTNAEFCCELLSGWVADAGRKGFSIVPAEYKGNYYFLLQFRRGDYSEVKNETTIAQQAIKYCPRCGFSLNELIAENKDEIIKLVEMNKHLIV